MKSIPDPRKSGQAIIFLMVVMVIGLLAVVWNYDLHRVISAKLRIRNAGDSAAIAAARWQGHTLNMIGDLNLIQAAIISTSYDEVGVDTDGDGIEDSTTIEFFVPDNAAELHELRSRLEFVGPLGAYAVAQQTAFNNGALPDPELASNLVSLAEDVREQVARRPYDNAFDEYADLLEDLAVRGVAVSAYALRMRKHPLVQETFYAAIAQAVANWWCPMRRYDYWLENYEDFESWPKLDTEFKHRYILDLKLNEFDTGFIQRADGEVVPKKPQSAMPDDEDYLEELYDYLNSNEVVEAFGEPGMVYGMYEPELTDVQWHVFDSSWAKQWPRPTFYDDETDERGGRFPIRDNVIYKYNYLGAVAGVAMSADVDRGILSSSDNMTVDLEYKAKAKPFGFLNLDAGQEPPHYFGFVFPCFEDVRLVHSDIGDRVLSGVLYEHITQHLEPYLENGPGATDPQCVYCRLLVKWEDLDRQEGLEWLDRAYNDDHDNPCKPELGEESPVWGKAGGGATGGS
jgi:hypothetical protein